MSTFIDACTNGDLDVAIQYYKSSECVIAIKSACNNSNFHVANRLLQVVSTTSIPKIFEWACELGRLDIVKWLSQSRCDITSDYETCVSSLTQAFKNGHLNVALWLLEINSHMPIATFQYSCYKGNLNMAQWLLLVNPTLNVSSENEYAFCAACYNNQIQVAQWLLQVKPTINTSMYNEEPFRVACENGHLQVAQWLLQINPTLNVSAYNNYAFRMACANGHLQVAQWLLQSKPAINITAHNNYAFRMACANGHLQVAQWLLLSEPTIDITALNNYAFRYSCVDGHMKVAQWLQRLDPFKYFVTVTKLRTKLRTKHSESCIRWNIHNEHHCNLLFMLYVFQGNFVSPVVADFMSTFA